MRILVSNDDGIDSPGIAALADELSKLGDVHVVAPDVERSAVGHAITLFEPLRVHALVRDGQEFGVAVSGTPADCVKLGVQALFPEPPDLVVSGINRGANTGINVIYSGTVSAATEGTILGVPSMAISIAAFDPLDYGPAARIARTMAERVLETGLPQGTLLNVNVPNLPEGELRGLLLTRQGNARFLERFDARTDPRNRTYYWMDGDQVDEPEPPGSDELAVRAGFVSVTPIQCDLTSWKQLDHLAEVLHPLGVKKCPDLPSG